MKTHRLLNGRTLDLGEISPPEKKFLRDLRRMGKQEISYFEICRTAVGPGSPALRGRQTIDRRTAETPLYLAAEDIATRAGIRQGLILAPEFEHLRPQFPTDGSHISAAQAADFIGISRAAVYKAINAGTLQALHIGNVTVVSKKSAMEYRQRRETAAESPHDREAVGTTSGAGKVKNLRAPSRRVRLAHGWGSGEERARKKESGRTRLPRRSREAKAGKSSYRTSPQ